MALLSSFDVIMSMPTPTPALRKFNRKYLGAAAVVASSGIGISWKTIRNDRKRQAGYLAHGRDPYTGGTATRLTDVLEGMRKGHILSPPVQKALRRMQEKDAKGHLSQWYDGVHAGTAREILAVIKEHPFVMRD